MGVIPPAAQFGSGDSAVHRDLKKFEEQEKRERERREEERKRALAAESRRRASQTSQKR